MGIKLTDGAISTIMNGVDLDKPIVQLLSYKKMPGAAVRYRLVLSDGVHFVTSAILGSQLNDLIECGTLDKNAVITLDKFVINNVSQENRKIIIILSLTICVSGETMGMSLGNPTQLQENAASNIPTPSVQSSTSYPSVNNANRGGNVQSIYKSSPTKTNYNNNNNNAPTTSWNNNNNAPTTSWNIKRESSEDRVIQPIEALSPYQNRWTIRARLSTKSNIRTWSNSKGEGKLFSMEFCDESGEIRVTAFKDECDKFYNMLEVGKVYFISRGQVKVANKRFTSIPHQYELVFTSDTTVELCNEKMDGVPLQHFNFVKIDHLERVDKDSIVDVIGVCKRVGDIQNLIARSTNRELKKRDLHIFDESKKEVCLTLWGEEAENFSGSVGAVIVVRGAKVSDFGGRSLSTGSGSLLVNPDIAETKSLHSWYDREGSRTESQSISNQGFLGGGSASWKSLAEANIPNTRMVDKADYFSVKAYPVFFRKESSMYKACASPDCQKKVIDQGNGMYRCEKCRQDSPDFKWRLLMSLNVADTTDNMWVTSFQDSSEIILGKSCKDLAELKEQNEEALHAVFNAAAFECFIFKLRTKMEAYNDENRIKTAVVSVTPVDYAVYNKKLLADLNNLLSA